MATRKRPATKTGRPRARKGVKLQPTELGARDLRLAEPPPELAELVRQVQADGGAVLAAYREPIGGHALLFTALPLDKVERTPFQRDVSDAHVRKLTLAMDKTKRYLDPIIAVREGDRYLTPNGGHRLTASGAGREDGPRAPRPRAGGRLPHPRPRVGRSTRSLGLMTCVTVTDSAREDVERTAHRACQPVASFVLTGSARRDEIVSAECFDP